MYNAVKKNIKTDIAIFTAAVSRFNSIKFSKNKIKKENLQIINLKKK